MTQAFTVIPLVNDHDRIIYPMENSLGKQRSATANQSVESYVALTCILPQGWSKCIGQLTL